jgi:hypothetical protein
VLVLVANLLPAAIYPAYAFAAYCGTAWALVFVPGYLLPSTGALFHSTVAATVFYQLHGASSSHQGTAAIPLMAKLAS